MAAWVEGMAAGVVYLSQWADAAGTAARLSPPGGCPGLFLIPTSSP